MNDLYDANILATPELSDLPMTTSTISATGITTADTMMMMEIEKEMISTASSSLPLVINDSELTTIHHINHPPLLDVKKTPLTPRKTSSNNTNISATNTINSYYNEINSNNNTCHSDSKDNHHQGTAYNLFLQFTNEVEENIDPSNKNTQEKVSSSSSSLLSSFPSFKKKVVSDIIIIIIIMLTCTRSNISFVKRRDTSVENNTSVTACLVSVLLALLSNDLMKSTQIESSCTVTAPKDFFPIRTLGDNDDDSDDDDDTDTDENDDDDDDDDDNDDDHDDHVHHPPQHIKTRIVYHITSHYIISSAINQSINQSINR
jgi:hypothetical protein